MEREEAIQILKAIIVYDCYPKSAGEETKEAIDMAIEALSKPNYETDTEVRLAVTNRKKEKVILWDVFGKVEYYPTEALSAEGVYGRPTTKDTLISREELNNALAQYVADGYAESADDYKAYCDIIDNLPNRLTEYDTFCGVDMEEAIKVMTKYNEEYNKQTEQTDKYPWEAIPCEEHYKLPGHDEVMNALDKLQIKYKTKEDEQVISKLNDSNCQHGRLIDADALMEKIYDSTYPLYSRQFEGYVIPMSRLEEIINNAPTVSARPHGEWIRNELWGMPFYRCSVCGFHGQKDFDFCPACGNEMIGESEDK